MDGRAVSASDGIGFERVGIYGKGGESLCVRHSAVFDSNINRLAYGLKLRYFIFVKIIIL